MPNSRIAAGGLNNPIIYDRESDGLLVGQLVTDFGRTHELAKSSDLHAQAQQENVVTSQQDVLLQVDQAYFGVLKAQAVLQVAQETVKDRQLVADQISAMAKNLLKSDLDVSFANVDLSQAQLLLIQAQNDVQASFADLSTALGYADQRTFALAEIPVPPAPPYGSCQPDSASAAESAGADQPAPGRELGANLRHGRARPLFSNGLGAGQPPGLTPVRQTHSPTAMRPRASTSISPSSMDTCSAPCTAKRTFRAQAEQQRLRDLQDAIVRDVRTAWLNANAGFQRLSVTEQLLSQATLAMNLAQARYNLGLEFDRRAQPGAIELDAGADRRGQRQI